MGDIKNPFNFGTGNIDKDQWLKDIDNEQEGFITMYGSATNKHRTALLRQAFLDLRRRIASGDMLSRTADGLYQFGSALLNEDKHMLEAYQRALGFMGNLARKLINTPTTEPEKKKFEATTLEEAYKKHLFPGKFNEQAYWDRDEAKRKQSLIDFLEGYTKDGALDSYQDFGDFESSDKLKVRINLALEALRNGQEMDYNLGRLGFQGSWITKPVEEQEKPKSELEQANERLKAATEAQQIQQINQLIADLTTPSPTYQTLLTFNPSDYWNYDSFTRDRNKRIEALKYTDENGNEFLKANSILRRTPTGNGHFTNQVTTRNTAWNGLAAKDARTYALSQYALEISSKLNNYFKNLGVNYQSILNNNRRDLMTNLALLFTQGPDNNYVLSDILNNLFVRLLDGKFGLRGSTLSYDPTSHTLYNGINIDNYGEGGIIKGQNGLLVDDSYYVKPANNAKKPEEAPKLENSEEIDTGDWITILGTTAADIGSMLSANAVGAGTAVSAGLGVASTLGNSVNDFRHGNVGSGLANLGIGLTTDLVGLIPGFGAGAKGYKIGRTLTRFARPLMAAFTANNFNEAGEVLGRGVRNGFGNLTALDWTVLSTALTSMISRGKSAHTRLKNVEFMSKASQHSSPTDAKGNVTKHIINEEGLIKARKELLDLKRFGYNTSSEKYTKNVWNSIPEGGEIATPFYAKPFEYPKFGFGKNKKLKLVEEFEEFLKKNKKPKASSLGSGPEAPVVVPNENANGFYPMIRNGAKLKALRNGGIIKAETGVKLNSGRDKTWYSDVFSNYEGNILSRLKGLEGDDRLKAVDWLNGMLDLHYALYRDRGDFNTTTQFDQRVKAYQEAYSDGDGFIPLPNGFNIGIGANYNERYNFGGTPRTSGDHPTEFKNDGLYSAITDDRRVLGRTGDWSEENLSAFNAKLGELGYVMDNKYDDGYYRIKPLDGAAKAATNDAVLLLLQASAKPGDTVGNNGSNVVATETERDTVPITKFDNPFDPTPVITGLKYALGIAGNNNIYGNLLKEMPQAPLRDPIDRKLAIMGDLRVIDEARNKLGDLRRINMQLRGSDSQVNFATSLETERIGREIMDNAFRLDAVRLFDTALKSWNIDNEDIMYNTQVADANRKSIADRARMMAQIRAAWRSGNLNLAMGALSDIGNWMMKKYQTQMDTINKAREISLGTPEELAQSLLYENDKEYARIMDKYLSGLTLTPEETSYVKTALVKALRTIRQDYSKKYYDLYRTPGFGGGYRTTIAKDGTKLEAEKLKARGKDNDRYVNMIKDLRKTSYRRRRR